MIFNKIKILFDTNIIIDIFERRIDDFTIDLFYLIFAIKKYRFVIVSKQITDIYYILRKFEFGKSERIKIILKILDMFNILNFTKKDIFNGININGPDFEDNVLIAVAIKNKIDYIVSNNKKDFEFCKDITTIDSSQFINLFY